MTKMTKKDYFNAITAIIEASEAENKADCLAFIEHEVELLNKKAASAKSKSNSANEALRELIKTALIEMAKPVTVSEIQNAYPELLVANGVCISNQKVTRFLNDMVKTGEVVKTYAKGRSYFTIAK